MSGNQKQKERIFKEAARTALGIETLATRKSDDLDFHEVAVWQLRQAFESVWSASETIRQS